MSDTSESNGEAFARVVAEWTAAWEERLGFHPEEHPKPVSDYNQASPMVDATLEADVDLENRLREAGVL